MITSKEKSAHLKSVNNGSEQLVNKFYKLRKAFKEGYTGKLRSQKYEETREFTISLNYAIFEANQLDVEAINYFQNKSELEIKLQNLKTDWNHLKL